MYLDFTYLNNESAIPNLLNPVDIVELIKNDVPPHRADDPVHLYKAFLRLGLFSANTLLQKQKLARLSFRYRRNDEEDLLSEWGRFVRIIRTGFLQNWFHGRSYIASFVLF